MAASFKRVGHKGADLIEPGNTRASFDAALAHRVDMIELDVLPERLDGEGMLHLAHDYEDAGKRTPLTLGEGLEHLAAPRFAGIELIVDLKLRGYELRVLRALEESVAVRDTRPRSAFVRELRVMAAQLSGISARPNRRRLMRWRRGCDDFASAAGPEDPRSHNQSLKRRDSRKRRSAPPIPAG